MNIETPIEEKANFFAMLAKKYLFLTLKRFFTCIFKLKSIKRILWAVDKLRDK